jgi:hypothetical protein
MIRIEDWEVVCKVIRKRSTMEIPSHQSRQCSVVMQLNTTRVAALPAMEKEVRGGERKPIRPWVAAVTELPQPSGSESCPTDKKKDLRTDSQMVGGSIRLTNGHHGEFTSESLFNGGHDFAELLSTNRHVTTSSSRRQHVEVVQWRRSLLKILRGTA